MTFENWQKTKKLVSANSEETFGYVCADEETKECWFYAGDLIIECRPGHRYLLQLPMEEEVGEDLERLERRLYDYGVQNGNIEQ